MPEFVYDMAPAQLAITMSLITIMAMVLGLLIIKPIFRLLIGTGPNFNQTLSFATGGFSLFYGLLLGLLTVAAYQNSERVKEGALAEAATLGSLYADVDAYPEPVRSDLRAMMRDYVLFTIHRDWDAHRDGELLGGGTTRSAAMRQILADYEPETMGQGIRHAEVVSGFQDFTQARQQRIAGVIAAIPAVLWYAVLVGAAVNILLIVLLKMPLLQHYVLGTISEFFLGVILFVIVTLDRPLRGEAALEPTSMQLLGERVRVWDEPLS